MTDPRQAVHDALNAGSQAVVAPVAPGSVFHGAPSVADLQGPDPIGDGLLRPLTDALPGMLRPGELARASSL